MKIKNIIVFCVLLFFIFIIAQQILLFLTMNQAYTYMNMEKMSNQNPIDKIIYINLDKRIDRKNEIEGELKKIGIDDYIRFPAIENKNGALGCSKSNLECVKLAKQNGYKNVLILEDDFTLLVSKEQFYEEMNKLFSPNVNFDVCLLAYNTHYLHESEYPFLYKILDAQTTAGYIVNSSYYDTLIDTWEKAVAMFELTDDTQKYTCDQSWKPLQRKDNWYCFKNRIGKQRPSHSDIQGGFIDLGGI